MKHLLFVSVAVGIFSGTSLNLKAQTSVNFLRSDLKGSNSIKFVEGIQSEQEVVLDRLSKGSVTVPVSTIIEAPKEANKIENCTALQFKYALLTNREVERVTDINLYSFIDEWWATRYRYGGTTKKGVDCSAYVGTLVNQVYGFEVPRTAKAQYEICDKLIEEDLMEGDLVFFNTRGGVSHVGLYLGDGYFTHSSCSKGVTISNLKENYYSKRFIAGGRINE